MIRKQQLWYVEAWCKIDGGSMVEDRRLDSRRAAAIEDGAILSGS